jgi:hypothetical protein
LLCVISCLTLIEVPGQTSNTYYFRDFYVQEHGWPFVHLKRCVQRPATSAEQLPMVRSYLQEIADEDLSRPSDSEPGSAGWSDPSNWRVFSEYGVWYRWSFIANLSISLAIVLAMGGMFEWRRRHRKSVLQLTLSEIIVVLSFAGLSFATYRFAKERVQREAIARKAALEGVLVDFESRDLCPGWLSRLTDNNRYLQVKLNDGRSVPIGWRVVEIKIRDGASSFLGQPTPLELSKSLEELRSVTAISHWPGGPVTLKILNHYPPEKIKELHFNPTRCNDFQCVSRFTNVESLTFRGVDLESVKFDFPQLPKLQKFDLDYQHFSDRTIAWLKTLPELKEVTLWSASELDSELEGELIDQLQSSLPQVVIRDRLGQVIR